MKIERGCQLTNNNPARPRDRLPRRMLALQVSFLAVASYRNHASFSRQ